MGVARIPFLDFDVLHSEVQRVLPSLPPALQQRNRIGATRLYVGQERIYESVDASESYSGAEGGAGPRRNRDEGRDGVDCGRVEAYADA